MGDGSPCKTKVCECPSSSTAGDCDADQELVSTTSVTCGSTNVCQCKTIPDEPCQLPKTLKTVAVEGSTNGCTKRVCGCPSTQTADDCADDQEIKTETSDECGETRTCQCKTIADETPCDLPKVLTSVAVAGSTNGCQKKVCRCPSHSTDDDCDADETPCVLPKVLKTVAVPGSINGCQKKVCQCPSHSTDDDCDADQELVSTTTEVCGEIKTCKCKDIADEVCVAPKTLQTVPVVGSTNGCLKKGCPIETDFTDYISPVDGWLSVDKIEMKRCGGECASKSKWEDKKYAKNCSCCGVAQYGDQKITIRNLA